MYSIEYSYGSCPARSVRQLREPRSGLKSLARLEITVVPNDLNVRAESQPNGTELVKVSAFEAMISMAVWSILARHCSPPAAMTTTPALSIRSSVSHLLNHGKPG